jgi:RHS repeat-associated protein
MVQLGRDIFGTVDSPDYLSPPGRLGGLKATPRRGTFGPPKFWYGSLVFDQQDASGYLYRRNRYVDFATGRFTQEDPLGIAGGLNVYGFANGDPVSYTDPFGLCPNPAAAGWGSLECIWEDFKAGASQVVAQAGAALAEYLKTSADNSMACLHDPVCFGASFAGGLNVLGAAERSVVAERIAAGHAFEKHVLVRGEFQGLGIRTVKQLQSFVDEVIRNATGADVRYLRRGRIAYWDEATQTVVIYDPSRADLGTVFRPTNGRAYFETLK